MARARRESADGDPRQRRAASGGNRRNDGVPARQGLHMPEARGALVGAVGDSRGQRPISSISNLIDGRAEPPASGRTFEKLRPADGSPLCTAARSDGTDVAAAVAAARRAQPAWAALTPVERGRLVRELALALQARRDELAGVVADETGKSHELALGEADAAIEMGFFVAGEGRRLYGRTTTSAMPNRTVMATRRPVGVAALIVSFNTPLPNYAWKAFPAVFRGNTAVLKPSEHTPLSSAFFGELCGELLPPGVVNVVQG